ncbi:MAG: lipopolysaccharide biosynthesis protein [Acidimicrobiia bacterium]|nr:lipopolysaccharide biosynthesis protein [Acidimicrobiia bacterium]
MTTEIDPDSAPTWVDDGDELAEGAVKSGARWMAAGQLTLYLTRLVVTIVLARLILPEDRGLFATALVVTDLLERVVAASPGAALIQVRALTDRLASSVFYFNVLIGLAIAAVLAVGAPVVAPVLNNTEVVPVLRGVGLAFLALSLGQAQRALLRRSFRFAAVAVSDVANAVIQSVVSIVLAYKGWGVWALVWGLLAGKVAANIVLWAASPWRPSWHFSWSEVRSLRRFSGNLSAHSFFTYFSEAGDKFIVARISDVALGYYMIGYQLLLHPVSAVLSVSRNVLFPAFSRIQDDDEAIARGYVRACAPAAVLLFPIALGLAVVAGPFVRVVLGERWLPATTVLALFGPIAIVQAVTTTTSVLYQSKGRTDLQLRWGLPYGLLMLASYVIGSNWGAEGVAWGYLIGSTVLAVPGLLIPFRLVGLRLSTFLASFAPMALASVVMAAAVFACRRALEALDAGPEAVLFGSVAVGVVVYGALLLLLRPAAAVDLLSLAKLRRKEPAPAA